MSPCTSSVSFLRLVGASITVVFAGFSSISFAAEGGCSTPAEASESASFQAGQVVSVDPETGQLVRRARPENYREPQRDTRPVEIRELPDGTVTADVGDRFRAHLVAEIVDGKLVTCHQASQDHSDPVEVKEEQDE